MNSEVIKKRNQCKVCKNKNLNRVFTLGPTPLANAFLTKDQVDEPESFYPLEVYFCGKCGLLQLGHIVSPDILFRDYVYVSSTSPVFIKHFVDYANSVYNRFRLKKRRDLVVDIGSNDGILLKPFKKLGIRILGVDPALEIAKQATENDLETLPEYFDNAVVGEIKAKYGKAKVITANNVFAHTDTIGNIAENVKKLLTEDGVFIIEVAYLEDFLSKNLFDSVYHEHLFYWSLKPLKFFFNLLGMRIFDVKKVNTHGGSIRVFVQKQNGPYKIEKSVDKFIKNEENLKMDKLETYKKYALNIYKNKAKLIQLLTEIKLSSKTIAGYGAPAKGNTLLNFFGIGREMIDFIVDDSQLKQGLFTPGKHIHVVSSDMLKKQKPDYVLILAWNFADSIIKNNKWYTDKGGRFIIPVPVPKVI
jgi:SAM-dependent methyltransferase